MDLSNGTGDSKPSSTRDISQIRYNLGNILPLRGTKAGHVEQYKGWLFSSGEPRVSKVHLRVYILQLGSQPGAQTQLVLEPAVH